MFIVLCVVLWLRTAKHFSCFLCFVLFGALLLCLVDPIVHYEHFVGEEGSGCFTCF